MTPDVAPAPLSGMRVGRGLLICGLGGASLALGCGGQGASGFPSPEGNGAPDDGGLGAPDDASVASSDGAQSGAFFKSADASGIPPGVVFECRPGTYSGMFNTTVTNDAGGLFSLFSFNWTGSLSITLQGTVMTTSAGEFPSSTLTIAPGAKLAGKDMNGGNFTADLSGQLDCPSKAFSATIANGWYSYGVGDAGVSMQGSMSATYDGTVTPVMLSMGAMNLGSAQIQGTGAVGTWAATLQ